MSNRKSYATRCKMIILWEEKNEKWHSKHYKLTIMVTSNYFVDHISVVFNSPDMQPFGWQIFMVFDWTIKQKSNNFFQFVENLTFTINLLWYVLLNFTSFSNVFISRFFFLPEMSKNSLKLMTPEWKPTY